MLYPRALVSSTRLALCPWQKFGVTAAGTAFTPSSGDGDGFAEAALARPKIASADRATTMAARVDAGRFNGLPVSSGLQEQNRAGRAIPPPFRVRLSYGLGREGGVTEFDTGRLPTKGRPSSWGGPPPVTRSAG